MQNNKISMIISSTTIVIGIAIATYVRNIIDKKKKNRKDLATNSVSGIIYYGIISIAIVFALLGLGIQKTNLLFILSSITIGLALGFQNVVRSFLYGLLIVIRKTFKLDDIIKIDDVEGTVVDFNLLTTTIKNRQGVKTDIPNSRIFEGKLTNITREPEIRINITFKISNSQNIDVNSLLDIIKKTIGLSKYVIDKNTVFAGIKDISNNGTIVSTSAKINSKNYFEAQNNIRMNIYKVLKNSKLLRENIRINS
jgi:small-conductance mechanosensitive channel